jgi:plastocyanin
MNKVSWLAISCLAGVWAVACSSTTSSGTQGTSSGGGSSTSTTTTEGTTTSNSSTTSNTSTTGSTTTTTSTSSSTMVNGCDPSTTTVSSGNVTITFPMAAAPMQYSPACVKVHMGSTVTWNGSFTNHPLTPDGTGNPIPSTSAGTTPVTVTFPTAGSYGFHCQFHASMLGAVFVVP